MKDFTRPTSQSSSRSRDTAFARRCFTRLIDMPLRSAMAVKLMPWNCILTTNWTSGAKRPTARFTRSATSSGG